MADRLVQAHILQDVTFATGKSFPRPNQAAYLKVLGDTVGQEALTHHEALTPPSMNTAMQNLRKVFIEWDAEPPFKHKLLGNGKVIVGNHNAAEFHSLLNSGKKDQCAHIILCDFQYDGLSGGKNITTSADADFQSNSEILTLGKPDKTIEVPNPPVQKGAKLFLGGTWSNARTKKSGTLTDDKSKTSDDIGLATWLDEQDWKVDLPKNAAPSATSVVKVILDCTAASGPWGGDGGSAPHNLIVIDTDNTIHTMCVMHELGHIMNMTPFVGYLRGASTWDLSREPDFPVYAIAKTNTEDNAQPKVGYGSMVLSSVETGEVLIYPMKDDFGP